MHPALSAYLSTFPSLSEEEIKDIGGQIRVEAFKKGVLLLKEEEIYSTCYFILQGCIRQYMLVDGEEKTTAFYTEEQAVVSFASYKEQKPAGHYLACVEDSILIMGDFNQEEEMYRKFPKLEIITRKMMEQDFGKTQQALSAFIISSPEQRYLDLLENRPGLLQRVPQHQLASYLGITPESLSRIRKRIVSKK